MRTNIIICDTREQKDSHITEWFQMNSVKTIRSKLYVGDYTLVHDMTVCIDRKAGLSEVYSNLIQQHARFKAELVRAIEAEIHLIILVEEPSVLKLEDVADWRNPRAEIWRKSGRHGSPPVSSLTLMKTMKTISEKYGCEWLFCDKRDTARVITDILFYGGGLK